MHQILIKLMIPGQEEGLLVAVGLKEVLCYVLVSQQTGK